LCSDPWALSFIFKASKDGSSRSDKRNDETAKENRSLQETIAAYEGRPKAGGLRLTAWVELDATNRLDNPERRVTKQSKPA